MKQFASPRTGLRSFTRASALIVPACCSALASDELTPHTTRDPALIPPLLASRTNSSGLNVTIVYSNVGTLERVHA